MSTYYISQKMHFNNAEQFKESFSESANPTIGYLFIGKHIPYDNESSPDNIYDTINNEKYIWDNMIAAKKITGTDLELVIPRYNYAPERNYIQYDDEILLENLITANSNSYPFYVINSENNVYKCLSNNNLSISTIEPTGIGVGSQGIVTTTDSYIWKFMYTVPEDNRFSTNNWIPAPTTNNRLVYSANTSNAVDGEIISITLTNSGNNYFNKTIEVGTFTSSQSTITYSATVNVASTLAINMGLSGTGIQEDTYITDIDEFNRLIYLSYPTISSGGGESNTIQVLTRSILVGDGYGALCNTQISNGHVEYIKLESFGKEYNYADVYIYGTGTDASARPIISPKFGHGFNPAKELGANTVLLSTKIESSNSISSNTTFRQYGLLINPHKYGESTPVSFSNAQTTISQTTDVTLLQLPSGYNDNEFVYQGSISNPSFSGIINEKNTELYKLKLTNVRGTISIGFVLKSNSVISGVSVQDIDYPEFESYSGDIIYVKNIESIQRTEDQSETVKFIVKF